MANDNKYVKYENKSVKITGKPASKENIAVYVRPGDLVDFRIPGVNLEDLQYELVGGDIVINIPNYGTFTFVSLALMGFNDSPPRFLSSSGKQFTLGDILSEVEQINNLPIDSLVSNAEINIPDNTARKNEDGDETQNNPKSTPQVIIQEVEVDQAKSDNLEESISDFEIPPIENEEVSTNDFISKEDATNTNSNSSVVEGATPTLSFDIDIQHVGLDDQTSSNVLTVNGGGGVSYDNIYPDTNTTIDREAITKQTDAEVIDYSNVTSVQASSVVIYADNSSYFDIDKISRTITLNPEQPEGFAIETISISTSEVVDGFTVSYGILVDGIWTITKDNPDTTEIDGFTFDSAGNIEITITLDRSQTNSNFELTVSAESIFNIENIPEENRSLIETPVTTELTYEKNYGVNVKEISDLSDPDEYLFESFSNSYGEEVSTGFVITTNINDNIIYGSETLENTIYGGLANDTITTGSADDTIYGSSGDDIITSGLGDDTVVGGEGNDTLDFSSIDLLTNIGINANLTTGIVTGDGTDKVSEIENITGTQDNDILIGDSNNNILKGEGGADTLIGYAGNDTIEGGDSSDTIEGGLGDDILKGDDGTDTVSYQNATSSTNNGVTVTLEVDENNPGVGSASGIDGNDVLYDFENVIGSNYNDTITGNNATNIITALDGDDYIVSLMGNDTIYGGDGIDTLDFSNASAAEEIDLTINRARGAEGTDRIYDVENIIGSNFKDTITGDSANNVLDGREDDDTLFGGDGDDTLLGGFDSDTLYGGAGDDIIDGEEGEDTANYSDILTGGVTVSLAIQGASQDTVNAGDDLLIDIENLIGTAFNDTLYGDSKANTIIGGSGDDTIATGGVSALGEDYIDGGSGSNDLVTFTDSPNAISLDLAITTSQDTGFGSLTVVNIENVEGSSYNDTLKGNSSSNTLLGFDGNDTLIGREGNDFLDGGNGVDEVDYTDASTGVYLTLAETGLTATANIGSQTDTIKDIENITGSNFADVLGGNSLNNSINASLGDDSLIASDGRDILNGGVGKDTVDYSARSNSIYVELNENQEAILQENGVDKDSLFSIENVIGSSADDTILGDSLDNTLKGKEGDDTLYGNAGNDYIDGGKELDGTQGSDTVDFSRAEGSGVSVNLSQTTQQFVSSTEGFDTFVNIENIVGSAFNDILSGNSEDNILDGGEGNDTLKGGAGDDTFIGGNGIDTVDYSDVTQDLYVDLKSLVSVEVAIGQGIDSFSSIEGVIGGSGDDTLIGTTGANNIVGGLGDDTLVGFGVTDGSGGVDTLDGGVGTDLISFGFTSDDITIDLSNSSEQNIGIGKLVVTNVENIFGGYGDDTITGDDEDNTIWGSFGSDTLVSSGGNDTLIGGKDSEQNRFTITSISPISFMVAGVLISATGASASELINNLIVEFNAQNEATSTDLGTIGTDGTYIYLETTEAITSVTNLTQKNDFTFIDTVDYSSLTTESINVNLATETVNISDGTVDTIIDIERVLGSQTSDTLTGDNRANILRGEAGDDIITGGLDADTLYGDAGNDTFISLLNDGIDTIYGGTGSDTVDYSVESDNIVVTLNDSSQVRVNINGFDNDYIQEVENITTGSGNDTLVGDLNNNTFIANAGNDTLTGGLGNDYLDGGTGTEDKVLYSYITSNNGVNVDLANQSATDLNSGSEVGSDTLINIENVLGTKNDDIIKGNSSDNTLEGALGNDSLVGNDGDDYLDGGDGNDILKGGAGNDYLSGGAGIDTADFSDATASINVDLSSTGSVDIGAGLGSDYFDSIEGAIGGNFNDTIKGTTGANSLVGGLGDDTLLGGGTTSGYDYIDGGEGNETTGDFVSYSYIKDETQAVTINLGLSYGATDGGHIFNDSDSTVDTYQNAGAAGNLQIVNVENLEGGAGNDTLIGSSDSNTLVGGVGNDWLVGAAGNNVLIGGESKTSDSLTIDETNSDALAGLGIDTADYSKITSDFGIVANMNAGSEADSATIQTGQVTYNGISVDTLYGIENIRASKNDDTIIGDTDDNVSNLFEGMEGKDIISGGAGNDIIYGEQLGNATLGVTDLTTLADTLSGGLGDDTIYGQGGDDTLIGNEGVDTLDGGTGSDTVDYSYLNSGTNSVTVDFTNNTANDGSDTDILNSIENANGSINSDTFIMASGTTSNIVDGKDGIDTIDFSNYTTNAITVNLGTTATQEIVTGDNDTIKNIENILATILNDTITGSDANNSLDGNEGSDRFFSSSGNDTINGGVDATSNDTDIADYSNASQRIIVTSGTTVDKTTGFTDTLQNIEIIQGTDYKDTMTGGTSTDIFKGGANDDILDGAAGDDTLYGETGDDTLRGGTGNDNLYGGTNLTTGDTADYSQRNESVTLTLNSGSGTASIGSSGEVDTLYEIENITGSSVNDTITGDDNANILDGFSGDDTLVGGSGIDTLKGGSGNDKLDGGADADYLYGEDGNDTFVGSIFTGDTIDGGADTTGDTIDYSSLTQSVEVTLNDSSKANVKVGSQTTDHTIQNIENIIGTDDIDKLTGNSLDNTFEGRDGDDVLKGADGNDYLDGGSGVDTLEGGTGNDTLYGQDGNDILKGGAGNDLLDGGAGVDTADFSDATASITVDLANSGAIDIGAGLGTDTFVSIEGVIGGIYNDILKGTSGQNTLIGGAGNDTLYGLGSDSGADYLDGGDGTEDFVSFDYAVPANGGITVDLSNENAQDTDGDRTGNIFEGLGDKTVTHQDINISNLKGNEFKLNAEFAGYDGYDTDTGEIKVIFKDAQGNVVGEFTSGSMEADIGFKSIDTISSTIPEGSVTATIEMTMIRINGTYANAEFDNISFVIGSSETSIITQEDTSVTITSSELLANDTDVDGDTLTISSVQDATHGTVSLDENGNVVFTPDENYNGEANFTYTISDGNGGTSTATVTLNVSSVNDAPVIEIASTASVNEDGTLTINSNDWSATDIEDGDLIPTLSATNGTVEIVNGNIVYTPNENYNGSDTITVSVTDSNGETTTQNIAITVNAIDDATVTQSDSVTIDEDNVASGNVLSNDSDIDDNLEVTTFEVSGITYNVGDNATIANVGSVTISSNGDYTFTPIENYNGNIPTIGYTTNTGATSTLDIKVNAINDGPVANDDNQISNGTISVNTTGNDQALVVDCTGTNPDLLGGATSLDIAISFSASASEVSHQSALMSYAANGQNNEFLLFNELNGNLYLHLNGSILDTHIDTDEIYDGSIHNVRVTWDSSTGEVDFYLDNSLISTQTIAQGYTIKSDGIIMFGQEQDSVGGGLSTFQKFSGTYDNISIGVNGEEVAAWDMSSISEDGVVNATVGNFDLVATENLTIASGIKIHATEEIYVNKSDIITQEDTSVTITSSELLANDTDVDGDTLTISSVQDATHGTVSLDENGNVVFTPDENYNGEANFTYTISDGNGGTSTATVTLNVSSVNDAPVIEIASTASVNEDGTLTINSNDWSATDIEDGDLIPTLSATNGTVEIVNGNIVYTPNENYNGSDTITVSVTDSNGETTIQNIAVTVNAVNDAVTDLIDTDNTSNYVIENSEDGTYTGITLNATDADGDNITYSLPDNVPFSIDENGRIIVDGEVDYERTNHAYTFDVTATSSDGTSTTKSMTINVGNIDIESIKDLGGDEDGIPITFKLNCDPYDVATSPDTEANAQYEIYINGEKFVDAEGNSVFTVDASRLYIDENNKIVYTNTEYELVTLNVPNGTIINTISVKFLNDGYDGAEDKDGDGITVEDRNLSVVSLNIGGEVQSDGTIIGGTTYSGADKDYVEFINPNGTENSSYNNIMAWQGELKFTVNNAVSEIIDSDNEFDTVSENLAVGSYTGITVEATDADGEKVTYSIKEDVPFEIDENGKIVTTEELDYETTSSYTFTVIATSEDGTTSEKEFTINVSDIVENIAPEASDDSVTTNEDTDYTLTVNDFGYSDADGDSLSEIQITSLPNSGTLSLNAVAVSANDIISVSDISNGNLIFEPIDDMNGITTFDFKVSDGLLWSDEATTTITVNAVADDTVTTVDEVTVDEDNSIDINVLANDTDVDGTVASVESVTQGSHGTVEINSDGTVKYTPDADYNGTDSFTYTNTDGNTETVNVTVDPTNDVPIAVDDIGESRAGEVLVSEDFESGTATGWTDNTVTQTDGSATNFLGQFAGTGGEEGVSKTFDLGIENAGKTVTIEFDMYEIDSWDDEQFMVFINNQMVESDFMSHYDRTWSQNATDEEDGGVEIDNIGSSGAYYLDHDEKHHYELEVTLDENGQVTLGFGSTLNSSTSDESWGIDNIVITATDNWTANEINEDTAITIDVLDNDTDLDGDELSIIQIQGQDVSAGQIVDVLDDSRNILGTAQVVNDEIVFTPSDYLQNLNDGENQTVTFDYTISDGEFTDNADVTVNVTGITDNLVPTSEDETQTLDLTDIPTIDTNLVITLDLSGSMTENDENVDRLAIAKETLENMIESFDGQGTVNVKLVTFSTYGDASTWMNAEDAIATIESLSAGGATNYEAAVYETYNNYTEPEADRTVAYFISDGEPTTEYRDSWSDSSRGENGYLDSSYQEGWNSFVDTYVDELHVVAMGSGIQDTSYLDILAQAGEVETTIVTNSDELNDYLVVENSISGNLLDNITGGDGVITIDSITIGGNTYTSDDMPLQTPEGGILNVNFSNGTYTYGGSTVNFGSDLTETFQVNASDENGDTTSFDVNINVDTEDGINAVTSNYNYWYDGEVIDGTSGNDYITIGEGSNKTINAGDGNDVIYTAPNDGVNETINGGAGNDKLIIDDVSDSGSYKYEITANEDGTFDIEKIGYNDSTQWSLNHYAVTVDSIEAIEFTDKTFVLNDSGNDFVESTDSSADDYLVAQLVDGVVEGIYYETTSGVTGFTDENGNFNFREGDSVTFSVGGVVLGTATAEDIASGKTFLQDIADVDRTDLNDEYLENMAVFLQSINTADSGDNIVITQAMHDALADVNIDLRTATEEEVKELIDSIGGNYVGEDEAMVHVQEMLEEYAGMDSSEFDERISDDLQSAILGNEPQSGIEYTTSSGLSGITDSSGTFSYSDGDEITFLKDGEVLSTIDSRAIGNDSMITFNELETLNQTEIDFDNLELDFDNLSEILDSENNAINNNDEIEDNSDVSINDMLVSDDSTLSNLLGETEADRNISSLDELKSEDDSTSSNNTLDEYCPFKTLEESSSNLVSHIQLDDTVDTDNHN